MANAISMFVSRLSLPRAGAWLAGLSGRGRMLAAFAAGALSALGFAPLELFVLLLLGYAVLVLLLDGAFAGSRPVRRFALTGWAFGFGQFLVGLYWIGDAFLVDASQHAWQIPFVETLLPGGLALFPAAACAAAFFFWRPGARRIFVFAAAFAVAEWLRGHVLTGFPWNLTAYGWGAVPAILQSTAVIGAYGLTLLTVLFGASLAEFFTRRSRAAVLPLAMTGLFAAMLIGGTVRLAETPRSTVPNVRLRIVQPNIPEREKFDPRYISRNWSRLVSLSTLRNGFDPTHIIWPEAAPPFLLLRAPLALDDVARITGSHRVLLTGAVRMQTDAQGVRKFYNSLLIFGHHGTLAGVYDKFHLVPFGEYMPWASFFHALGIDKLVDTPGSFSTGDGPRTFSVPGAPPVDPLICYEIIFPGAVVGSTRPQWIVNVTNDSWFGTWAGPHQHLLIARVRAIEEGLPVIRAAGTGISAVIDPLGRILAQLGLDHMGVVDAKLPVALAATPYARIGDLMFLILVVVVIVIAGWPAAKIS